MSNVRLSNGSPTLERMDAGQSDHPKPSACRNLFGPVDHEELRRDLKRHLQEMEEAASARWNFDFPSHKPLPHGRYEWQSVDGKDVPNFYKVPPWASKGILSTGNNNVDLNGNHNCLVVRSCQDSAEDRFSDEKTEKSESQADNRNQFTGQRKRPASHESSSPSQNKRSRTSSDEVNRTPVLTHSVEHTPRKTSPNTQT